MVVFVLVSVSSRIVSMILLFLLSWTKERIWSSIGLCCRCRHSLPDTSQVQLRTLPASLFSLWRESACSFWFLCLELQQQRFLILVPFSMTKIRIGSRVLVKSGIGQVIQVESDSHSNLVLVRATVSLSLFLFLLRSREAVPCTIQWWAPKLG